ncbi:uncharacterized protein LOC129956879 isoform X1 [Argiope bruennichi]|uniref:uncharacterized protein LOC129956879 isoform X1 n=1 Tax=Argiope bruennichi TaxID=94029 RepID=UPI0024956F5A|nr:uncharacterized protein LOC129956879 isoform X1 [Argiope bruennichi]XP_055924836.1 uncharacterized protein LOC129956879 isoform X1 [Argiope bruennichi]XP_055924837.1 uncharacterized protein LOC129956879 isoform X1 [Argiope bruennichi]XP_055924838.1 uncharacterized protein LOC129956879 isoform X1 [Argiope bruennichi]XP_055924839.1 uncharacterized protein LOC129956879 isoform X1 [Argiope bruennichi]XP_055924840.1 uncharacterized protein LOC129956879 isoform X1 [Argiope bruennichi]XP_05592484
MSNPIVSQLKSLYRLSLQDISLRKVAVLLVSDPVKYISPSTVVYRDGEERIKLKHELFKSIVAELSLPESMREPLSNLLNPIFMETYKWWKYHEFFLRSKHSIFDCPEYVKYLHWTHMGTVNYRKTAEAMIRDEKLDINRRFKLACLYCLDEDIQNIWQKMSPLSKKCFYNNGQFPLCNDTGEIIIFWTCILKGRVDKLKSYLVGWVGHYSSIYQQAFELFAKNGYETATQYFFEKLTCEEKDASLVRTAEYVAEHVNDSFHPYTEVFYYLLTKMNTEQFQNVLEKSSCAILRSFLDWPRQDAFLEVAQLVLPFFVEDDYEMLQFVLLQQFKYLYNPSKLFQNLFLITPKGFRHSTNYLDNFFKRKDTENIKFMFTNMDPEETLELVMSRKALHKCYELVKEGKWDFLEFFMRESRLSKEDRERFAEAFNSNFSSLLELEIRERLTKVVNDIPTGTSNRDFSSCNKINQMDPMDFQPSGQPDEELIERPAKKIKKI